MGRFGRVEQADDGGFTVRRCGSGVADGEVVGVEELSDGMDVVGHVEVFDGEFLGLEGGPVGWRAGGARDADAVAVAELDGAEEALGE